MIALGIASAARTAAIYCERRRGRGDLPARPRLGVGRSWRNNGGAKNCLKHWRTPEFARARTNSRGKPQDWRGSAPDRFLRAAALSFTTL
jgi:hypothetical protein